MKWEDKTKSRLISKVSREMLFLVSAMLFSTIVCSFTVRAAEGTSQHTFGDFAGFYIRDKAGSDLIGNESTMEIFQGTDIKGFRAELHQDTSITELSYDRYEIRDNTLVGISMADSSVREDTFELSEDGSIHTVNWTGEYQWYPAAKEDYEEARMELLKKALENMDPGDVQFLKDSLGVPDNIIITGIEVSGPSYWDAAQIWMKYVGLYSNTEKVAGAFVDADTLELARTISPYSPNSEFIDYSKLAYK